MARTPEQKAKRLIQDRLDRADPVKGPRIRARAVDAGNRWRKRHSIEDRARQLAWWRGTRGGIVTGARQSAKLRGLECTITKADIRIPEFCPVLGIRLNPRAPNRSPDLPSLDRFDPSRGYVPGNVWVISWKANRLKHSASLPDLEALVAAMKIHQFRAHAYAWLRKAA